MLSAPESEEESEAEQPFAPDGGWGEDAVLETAKAKLQGGRGEAREGRGVETHAENSRREVITGPERTDPPASELALWSLARATE